MRLQNERFRDVIQKIPHKPGIYRYYNEGGDLLYVGKAKDLKNRVSSYFQDSKVHNQRIYTMINQIAKIEYTLVFNEKEALLLEANLIFSLQPRFNVLLKDEQNYVYVRFTYDDEIPGIFIERRKTSPKHTYYGPFFSKGRIAQVMRAVRMILPYCEKRTCDGSPCEYVSIGQCAGVCVGKEPRLEYLARLRQIENLFLGKTHEIESYLLQKMNAATQQENYALAAFWRDKKALLTSLFQRNFSEQKIVLPSPDSLDIITLLLDSDTDGLWTASLFVQSIREGKIVNVNNFLLSGVDFDTDIQQIAQTFLMRFLKSYYIFQKSDYPAIVQVYQTQSV